MTLATTRFYIVQHAEKAFGSGDPPLSALGAAQATRTGNYLAGRGIAGLYSSPLLRARQTAERIVTRLNLEVRIDDRLRERMNWGEGDGPQTTEEFFAEWERATRDRDFVPRSGDSSRAAGERFQSLLDELSQTSSGEAVALVAHGGVTMDLLRNLFGDDRLETTAPSLMETGLPGCGITLLRRRSGEYELRALASVAHLPSAERSAHRRD